MSGYLIINAPRNAGRCAWGGVHPDCHSLADYVLATPIGELGYCGDHIDGAVASLPHEWIQQWAVPDPPRDDSEIPF